MIACKFSNENNSGEKGRSHYLMKGSHKKGELKKERKVKEEVFKQAKTELDGLWIEFLCLHDQLDQFKER